MALKWQTMDDLLLRYQCTRTQDSSLSHWSLKEEQLGNELNRCPKNARRSHGSYMPFGGPDRLLKGDRHKRRVQLT